jgi:hypothetical protein
MFFENELRILRSSAISLHPNPAAELGILSNRTMLLRYGAMIAHTCRESQFVNRAFDPYRIFLVSASLNIGSIVTVNE